MESFADYNRLAVAEMGGRVLATFLGVLKALSDKGTQLRGRQYGGYAQSSGSGNANLLISDSDTLERMQ